MPLTPIIRPARQLRSSLTAHVLQPERRGARGAFVNGYHRARRHAISGGGLCGLHRPGEAVVHLGGARASLKIAMPGDILGLGAVISASQYEVTAETVPAPTEIEASAAMRFSPSSRSMAISSLPVGDGPLRRVRPQLHAPALACLGPPVGCAGGAAGLGGGVLRQD